MDENLFNQTYNQIVTSALGGNPNFQLLAVPQGFTFPPAPIGQIDPQAYQVISAMPHWAPVASYSTNDAKLVDTYRQVLSHITFKVSPEKQNDLNRLQAAVTTANNALTKATGDMNQAYLAEKQNGGLVFAAKYADINSWIAGPGAAYQHGIDNAQVNLTKAQDLLLQMQKASMPASLQNAIDAIQKPTDDPASATAPDGWVKVPDGSGILRWQPDYILGTSGTDWRASLSNGSVGAFSLSVNAGDSSSKITNSWAGAGASYGTPFWGVFSNGSWQRMNLTESDNSVKATISVQSSTIVNVNPGSWYDGGFMKDLALGKQGTSGDGYVISSPWTATTPPSALFGNKGLLSARVAGLVVAYKPSFSITMNSSTFSKYKDKYEAGGGVRIGPFTFGGDGGHSTEVTKSTSNNNSFIGGSTSEDPVIIGVIVAFPGTDNA